MGIDRRPICIQVDMGTLAELWLHWHGKLLSTRPSTIAVDSVRSSGHDVDYKTFCHDQSLQLAPTCDYMFVKSAALPQ